MGVSRAITSSAFAFLIAGCVDAFPGANVQIDFGAGTPTPARAGAAIPDDSQQPPANTYLSLYAANDTVENGEVVRSDVFEVQRFEIRPVIDTASPCFIDLDDARFPGLHATQFYPKLLEAVGLSAGDADPTKDAQTLVKFQSLSKGDRIDALGGRQRNLLLPQLENGVKTVASASLTFKYRGVAASCVENDANVDPTLIPPPGCTGEESNARRLKICKEEWKSDPNFYEGSDKVFSVPLNGVFYGVVEGTNPVNGGFLGGASMFVDESLLGADGFSIRWQFKDLDKNGSPDGDAVALCHSDVDGSQPVSTGCLLMEGSPFRAARGVISSRLVNTANPSIFGILAVFEDLSHDSVSF